MSPRKRLATFGTRGNLVRLFLETKKGAKRYIVQWGPKGARQQDSWPATKEGKLEAEAFFKAFGDELTKKADAKPQLTNRELWERYVEGEFEHLRKNTKRLYTDAWRTWEQFATPDAIAEQTSIETIHAFRKALDARNLATATVQDCIRNVRIVFNWGERNELIAANKWHLFVYKVAKEKRTKPRQEYRSDEFLRMWAALDPDVRGQWRAWVAVGLLGIYGNRPTEMLNLRWSWIQGDVVTIDPAFVKTGEEGTLRLFPLTRAILAVAERWRAAEGYRGDYVLFPGQRESQLTAAGANATTAEHYSIQSLTGAIHRAERRAVPPVPTIKWRAAHAFRRGLVGDLIDETGDVTLALHAIRDRDIRMAQRYRVRREDKVDTAVRNRAERLVPGGLEPGPGIESVPPDTPEGATKVQPTGENDEGASEGASVKSNYDKELQ